MILDVFTLAISAINCVSGITFLLRGRKALRFSETAWQYKYAFIWPDMNISVDRSLARASGIFFVILGGTLLLGGLLNLFVPGIGLLSAVFGFAVYLFAYLLVARLAKVSSSG